MFRVAAHLLCAVTPRKPGAPFVRRAFDQV